MGIIMKPFSRLLFLFSIVFAAAFSACSDSKSDSGQDIKQLRKVAEQGDADAQYDLGLCYYSGDGVEQDKSEAVKWSRKAAEQGHQGLRSPLESRRGSLGAP